MSKKSIGLLVKSKMVLLEKTQEDLAKDLNISRASVNSKLNGTRPFTVDEIKILSEKLDIPFREFFQ